MFVAEPFERLQFQRPVSGAFVFGKYYPVSSGDAGEPHRVFSGLIPMVVVTLTSVAGTPESVRHIDLPERPMLATRHPKKKTISSGSFAADRFFNCLRRQTVILCKMGGGAAGSEAAPNRLRRDPSHRRAPERNQRVDDYQFRVCDWPRSI